MMTYMVQVSHMRKVLLCEYTDSLSEAHILAKDIAEEGALVEIWEGLLGADTWYDPISLIYSYKLDKDDKKEDKMKIEVVEKVKEDFPCI